MGGSRSESSPDASSTITDFPDLDRVRKARMVRRIFVLLLFVFLGLGAVGFFGARTRTVSASGQGYVLSISYPATTRPGLAIRYVIRIHHPGGFPKELELFTTSEYLDLFDDNALDPEPADTTTTDDQTVWTFDSFDGDVLSVSLDARTEPARESGTSATTTLVVDGRPVVSVHYRTWVMP